MSGPDCAEMRLLIQAEQDGELGPAEAARLAQHLAGCADCAPLPGRLASLSARIKHDAPRYPAPDRLRTAVRAMAEPRRRRRFRLAGPNWAWFGAGFAVAACALLAVRPARVDDLPATVVADHIRALQPGHLMDVASTDQHTVKPWFDGRLDFAPQVKDLASAGFPLAGARLDYAAGRPVAALVYYRRQHPISLFVWPEARLRPARATSLNGYNAERWVRNGMQFWAVSDLDAKELAEFARLLQTD